MARKTIFMETAFWDGFSECLRTLLDSNAEGDPNAEGNDPVIVVEKISRWNDLFKFICRSKVYVDSPLSELGKKAKNDLMLSHLLKRNGGGEIDLEESKDPFPNVDSSEEFQIEGNHNSALFTLYDHRSGAREHGVINVSLGSIWSQNEKFRDTGEAIQAEKGFNWRKMTILKENSNGMVIIDNFVLSPNRKGICAIPYNLKEIFRLMLPEHSKEKYYISIFYFEKAENKDIREERRHQFIDSICAYITSKKPHLRFKLELFPTIANGQNYHKDFHDRTIVTNNVWIGSEAGFDLLYPDTTLATNARSTKSTTTHGVYLGFGDEYANWLYNAYDNFIADAKKCLNKYHYTTENRILL